MRIEIWVEDPDYLEECSIDRYDAGPDAYYTADTGRCGNDIYIKLEVERNAAGEWNVRVYKISKDEYEEGTEPGDPTPVRERILELLEPLLM